MADEQNKAVPTPAPAPDWMNQPTEGATSAPAPAQSPNLPQLPKMTVYGNAPKGMVEPGNIDLNNRPVVQNADGSHSTEFSTSFGTDKGEVLVPTVVNGKFLTPDGKKPPEGSPEEKAMFKAAQDHYGQTGEHMGIFDTPESADAYANAVHNRQDQQYGQPPTAQQTTEGKPQPPAATPPTPQTTIGPDFSAIPGYHPVQQDSSEQAQVRSEGGLPQRSTHRDTKAEMGVTPASLSTEPIENYTQEGRAEHPIISQLGDITKSLKELLAGGQYAGKPMGTESGVLNNPVTQAISATDVPEIAAAGEELLAKGASKVANAVLEHPYALAKHPEGSLEAGFAEIPGHRKLASPAEVTHTGHAGSINEVKLKQGEDDIAALHFTHEGDSASVNDTWVDANHRGEGHGQQLLREAAAKAKQNDPNLKYFTSDTNGETSPDAQHAWDALVRKGDAEETGATEGPKYRIKYPEPEKGNTQVAESAQRYNAAHGQNKIDHSPVELPSNEERAKLADAYDSAKHEPDNPAVQRSYDAMKRETLDQFHHFKNDGGIKYDFTEKDPYNSAEEMQADLRNNHHLSVWNQAELPKDHPLAEVEPTTGQTYNSLFRATHDTAGHAAGGNDFSEAGEHSAFGAHNQMYSPEARPAVRTETQGQSNWFFNNRDVRNGKALGDFPPNKATILPEIEKSANADIPRESANADMGKYHPDLQKIVDKYGESDDPYKTAHGASFITPEGKYVHLGSKTHPEAIEAATGERPTEDLKALGENMGRSNGPEDSRVRFLADTGAIRTRASFDRSGHTLHISVPEKGVTAEQVDALKGAARAALGSGKSGNIVMEIGTPGGAHATEEFANANNIEPMLKQLGAHPDPQAGMSWAERAEDVSKTQDGAFTVNPRTGAVPNSGHILEAVPEVRQISAKPNTANEIEKFSNKPEVKKLLKKYPELYVGGYKNSAGQYELNLSAVSKDAESAAKVAKATDQESFWDANNQKLVQTGGKNKQQDFPDYSIDQRLRDLAPKEPGDTVSSRVPSAVAATEDALRHNLTVGDKALIDRSPALADKWANTVRDYPGLKIPEGADSKAVINAFQDHVKDNLKWLYNQSTPEEQEANKGWYDGAHALSKDLANEHGYTHPQTAGVIAAMSPQKDWDMNVSLAKRLTNIYKNQQDFKATPEMIQKGKDIVKTTQAVTPKANAALAKVLNRIKGKSLSELKDPIERASWLRLYDETYNSREFPKIGADGKPGELRTNADGSPTQVVWGNANEVNKAMNILADGSRENISKTLSTNHKTRSFYNNIIEPNSDKGDVTIDTHAVAAGLMRPLSGFDQEVMSNFNSPTSSMEGLRGTYPLYHSAYTQAAKELDIAHPRQLQSVVWAKIRNLFPAEFKTPEAKEAVANIWKESQNGQITADQARQQILDYAQSHSGIHEAEQSANGQSQLLGSSVHGESAAGSGRGNRSGNSVGDKDEGPIFAREAKRKPSKGIPLSFLSSKPKYLK